MTKNLLLPALFLVVAIASSCDKHRGSDYYDVIVVGGGASGVMSGIQSARMGKKTLILEETVWLGGMLTSAGVSAIDGNYKLPSGLWEEFRQLIYAYYGGPDSVKTGWVSNVLFEPQVAARILRNMVEREELLEVHYESVVKTLQQRNGRWAVNYLLRNVDSTAEGLVLIDATELGDMAKLAGIPYDIGMDSRLDTDEEIAPEKANDIIQDLTYVAILQLFPQGEDKRIPKPEGYDPMRFRCTCEGFCDPDSVSRTLWDCDHMMRYGQLPNGKIMINWPIYGNDYYINAIELNRAERQKAFEKAKWFTKCYIYYLQTELGYSYLGIAEDVFPTDDGFPMIPYHRESRRIEGMVRFTINDLAIPFEQENPLYRTGVVVGDYPVDHHHAAYPNYQDLPDLHFYPVPSYSLPLGTLIPKVVDNFIVVEKSISVTNIVNGTTRLQPICLLIGQAAGVLAALAIENEVSPRDVPVRAVQTALLEEGCYLLPYADVPKEDLAFHAIQRIGVTGIIKGVGKNIGWENMTFFYPDSLVNGLELLEDLEEFAPVENLVLPEGPITTGDALELIIQLNDQEKLTTTVIASEEEMSQLWARFKLGPWDASRLITRKELAVLLDQAVNPFDTPVDLQGNFQLDKK